MTVKWNKDERKLTLGLSGELGHKEALEIIKDMPSAVRKECPGVFEIDMKGVTFMDSSGIAVAVQGKRLAGEQNAGFIISGAGKQAMKVFLAAGMDRIIDFTDGGLK